MSTVELWALGVGAWLAVGGLVALGLWFFEIMSQTESIGCYLLAAVFWPIVLVFAVIVGIGSIQVPPRAEWIARRREAAERRARPSEVTPMGRGRP